MVTNATKKPKKGSKEFKPAEPKESKPAELVADELTQPIAPSE